MTGILHPAWSSIFQRSFPKPTVLYHSSSTSDVGSYTFQNIPLSYGMGGSGIPGGVFQEHVGGGHAAIGAQVTSFPRASSRSVIIACLHNEDAAVTFSVTGCTLGGVSGQEVADRGGAGVALNTAMYLWDACNLTGTANVDLAITCSEATTAMAVGVIRVDNIKQAGMCGAVDTQTTGTMSIGVNPSQAQPLGAGYWAILATTSAADEDFQWTPWSTFGGGAQNQNHAGAGMEVLYDSQSAEHGYAAMFMYSPQYLYTGSDTSEALFSLDVAWSGAGNGDAQFVAFPA